MTKKAKQDKTRVNFERIFAKMADRACEAIYIPGTLSRLAPHTGEILSTRQLEGVLKIKKDHAYMKLRRLCRLGRLVMVRQGRGPECPTLYKILEVSGK